MIKLAIWEMEPVDSFIYLFFALKFGETFKNSANLNWILCIPGPCFQVSLEKYVCYSPLEEQASWGQLKN